MRLSDIKMCVDVVGGGRERERWESKRGVVWLASRFAVCWACRESVPRCARAPTLSTSTGAGKASGKKKKKKKTLQENFCGSGGGLVLKIQGPIFQCTTLAPIGYESTTVYSVGVRRLRYHGQLTVRPIGSLVEAHQMALSMEHRDFLNLSHHHQTHFDPVHVSAPVRFLTLPIRVLIPAQYICDLAFNCPARPSTFVVLEAINNTQQDSWIDPSSGRTQMRVPMAPG